MNAVTSMRHLGDSSVPPARGSGLKATRAAIKISTKPMRSVGVGRSPRNTTDAMTPTTGTSSVPRPAVPAGRRGAVALALHVGDSAPSERALKRKRPAADEAAMRFTRR